MTNNKRLKINIVVQVIMFFVLVAIDQLTKYIVVVTLKGKSPISLIKNIVEFQYLENYGSAFGFMQNKQWIFYIVTIIVFGAIIYIWIKSNSALHKYISIDTSLYEQKTFNNIVLINYILIIIASGAIGNFIDRISHKYVVDFIYFKCINFPIFNFADICVTIGAIMLIIVCIFIYKEDPNFKLFGKKEK